MPFGAADQTRLVPGQQVDIPLNRAREASIDAAPQRIIRKVKRGYAGVPSPTQMLVERCEILDRMGVQEGNPDRRRCCHAALSEPSVSVWSIGMWGPLRTKPARLPGAGISGPPVSTLSTGRNAVS